MKKIAIIPARGGSKRILRKNIKPFCGKPMLCYPIALARECGIFDEIVVSSEDSEILALAKKLDVQALLRPEALAGDEVATLPVIAQVCEALDLGAWDLVCCIYPATPLLRAESLLQGWQILMEEKPDYVFSAVEFESSPLRGFGLKNGEITPLFAQYLGRNSQDLEKIYHDAGAFYWGFASSFRLQKPIFTSHSKPVILPRMSAQDIDTPEDWKLAEMKYKMQSDG